MRGGLLIREARRRAGLTQAQLAEQLGSHQSVVGRWETGTREPAFATVARAVRACGLDLNVSLSSRDEDHERLIRDALARSPRERLEHLLDLLALEEALHKGKRQD